ncbi:MAG TPA: hypothetical protein VFZ84_01355 [Burkholderiales bacterium]
MDEASPTVLLSRLKELQHLLQSPGGEQQGPRVDALAMFIARRAPNLSIRELVMRVMTEAGKLRLAERAQYGDLNALLEQLRVAIAEVASKPSQ